MLSNTEENRMKLAQHVVDGWDMDDLVMFAVETLADNYKSSPEQFDDDAEYYEFAEAEPMEDF